jgi:hypothetical protein
MLVIFESSTPPTLVYAKNNKNNFSRIFGCFFNANADLCCCDCFRCVAFEEASSFDTKPELDITKKKRTRDARQEKGGEEAASDG